MAMTAKALEEAELMDSLEAALDGGLQHHESFVIDDDSKADWALRKIAQARRKLAQAQQLAEMEISRIQEWLRGQTEDANRTIGHFEALLYEYMQRVRAEDPKARSRKLPHGRLQLRSSVKWTYDDEALLAWLQANRPEFVRTKYEPDKAGLKRTVTADVQTGRAIDPTTGEAIPGVSVAEVETFSTEVDD